MAESVTALVVPKPEPKPQVKRGFIPGNPGNSGGKPGRSGRRPDLYNRALKQAARDPEIVARIAEIAKGSATTTVLTKDKEAVEIGPGFSESTQAARAIWEHGLPKEQRHIVEGAPPPLVVVFRHE